MALLFRSKVLVGLCVLSLFIATAFASFGGPFDFFGAAPFDPMPVPIVPPPLPPPPPPPPPPVVYVKKPYGYGGGYGGAFGGGFGGGGYGYGKK